MLALSRTNGPEMLFMERHGPAHTHHVERRVMCSDRLGIVNQPPSQLCSGSSASSTASDFRQIQCWNKVFIAFSKYKQTRKSTCLELPPACHHPCKFVPSSAKKVPILLCNNMTRIHYFWECFISRYTYECRKRC